MYLRLLELLRCPSCQSRLESTALDPDPVERGGEITTGLLHCKHCNHWFPIVHGIPRMLPDALREHWKTLQSCIPGPAPKSLRSMIQYVNSSRTVSYDRKTRENFSHEWDYHEFGGRTWGMELTDRVRWFFLEPIRIPVEELRGKVMLDAGCGNGSQSVAYSALGLEVIALDLSSGLELGHGYRWFYSDAVPEKVHFVQGDLQHPPLAPATFDIIHSAGVLHHTPDTLQTFRALRPLLRAGGTFFVWVYKYEQWVTPLVNSIRALTTKIPPAGFARLAQLMAVPFIGFCKTVNALGIRSYPKLSRHEAALALMDVFGAPFAHYHSYEEVASWYDATGFIEVWPCNDGRRGFGACGRLGPETVQQTHANNLSGQQVPAQVASVMHGKIS